MHVLHANWHGDSLHLWVEGLSAAKSARGLVRRDGDSGCDRDRSKTRNAPEREPSDPPASVTGVVHRHPFALEPAQIRSVLEEHALDCGAEAEDAALTLLLPHLPNGLPAASDRLAPFLDQDLEGDESLTLDTVELPSLRLPPLAALRFLRRLDGFEGHDHLLAGHELRFFAAMGRFVAELLADQRVVPALVTDAQGETHAAWRPWLVDGDAKGKASALVAGMPAIARAVEECDRADGAALVESALASLTDAAVRAALVAENYMEALDGADREQDPHAAWLAGLLGTESRVVEPAGEARLLRLTRQWLQLLDEAQEERSMRLLLELHEPELARDAGSPIRAEPGDDHRVNGTSDRACAEMVPGGGEGPVPPSPDSPRIETEFGPWRLSFSLISSESPPTILRAEEIWSDASGRAGERRAAAAEQAAETLLAELGRASRLYPRLERALSEGNPTGLDLDTSEAYSFLSEYMPLLDESGVKVLAPEWWGQPASRLGARLLIDSEDLPASPLALTDAQASRFGLSSLVRYQWQLAVGDQPLSLESFQSLAQRGTPIVRIGGRWVEIRREDLERGVKYLRENPGGETTLLEALRLAQGTSGRDASIQVLGVDSRGWVAEIFGPASISERLEQLRQPARFQGTLRPYQLAGLSWLAFLDRFGLGACLADDMGLGKTIQLIALLQHERERCPEGDRVGPTLLIAPMSVLGNWHRELTRFAPELGVHIHHGLDRPQGEAFDRAVASADVVITTYALATRDRDTLSRMEWRRVVLDEAQHIKNPPTKQTAAIRSLRARHRVALTGTPVENRLSELWSIMEFCAPGYLGSAGDFQRRFAVPIERHRDRDRAERLKALVRPFVLRRLKTDPKVITDLPSLVEMRQHVPLTDEQATLYDSVVEEMLRRVDRAEGMRRRGLVLSALVKLKQICNHPAHYLREALGASTAAEGAEEARMSDDAGTSAGAAEALDASDSSGPGAAWLASALHSADGPPLSARSGKSQRLMQMLEELHAAGDRALIFTQYRQMGHLLVAMIRRELDVEALFLHGGTPQGRRDQLVDRFQSGDPSCPVFILSLKAGGVGLNLTAANHVFHYDRWWNPAVENQATDRAFRIGQMRSVTVHKLVSAGTLEERIDQMIEQKTALAAQIIGSGEAWLTELSTAQLRELISLRHSSLEVGA